MKHIDVKEIISSKDYVGREVTVCGWVRTSRNSKSVAFVELNDGTSLKNIQVVVEKGDTDYKEPRVGMSLKVTGTVTEGRNNTVEINTAPDGITVLGECPQDYPLQKKGHTLEFLRSMPHLRGRTNTFNAVWRVRSVLAASLHEFFQKNNYVYVNTPLITGSDCEGAGEMFQVTTKNLYDLKKDKDGKIIYDDDFFGKQTSLTVSGQLEGELGATALGAIYTFGPTFRAENSNTPRHLAEFWMVEPEICFADLADDMDLAEDMIKYIFKYVLDNCPEEMEFFNNFIDKGLLERLNHVINSDFVRISYTDAVKELEKHNDEFEYKVSWGIDLQTEHERYLCEQIFKKPVFVTDYPMDIKAFYMKQNPDGKTVAAADLLVPGIGEIIGGSQREENYDKLLNRMKKLNMPIENYEWYLDLRKYGSCVHSGFGLGFERAIMYLTGMQNIRDVIPFPRTPKNCEF